MVFVADSSSSRRSLRGIATMALVCAVALCQAILSSTHLTARTTIMMHVDPLEKLPPSTSDSEKDNDAIETAPYLSACVYYMDDNHRLAEWLAYHYYTMNLRHVIMSVDYKSLTDPPQDMLDQWVSKGLLETAEIWHQRNYMKHGDYQSALHKTKNNISLHDSWFGNTQSDFYRKCAKEQKARNRTWVSFHDTDEFWLLNPDKIPDSLLRMSQAGSVLSYIVDGQADASKRIRSKMNSSAEIDQTTNETSSATVAPTSLPERYHGACITTTRLLFLPIDSQPLQLSRQVPSWVNPLSFETLRWRYHSSEKWTDNGKSLMDVSRIDMSVLDDPANFRGPHRLLSQCPNSWLDGDSYLRLHHYMGSWEYFNYKASDARAGASKARFAKAQHKRPRDVSHAGDDLRPWLIGFVHHVGDDTARELFQDQGVLRPLNSVPLGIRMEQSKAPNYSN
jgi:hypothetical protein